MAEYSSLMHQGKNELEISATAQRVIYENAREE